MPYNKVNFIIRYTVFIAWLLLIQTLMRNLLKFLRYDENSIVIILGRVFVIVGHTQKRKFDILSIERTDFYMCNPYANMPIWNYALIETAVGR